MAEVCSDDLRQALLRRSSLNGIDEIEPTGDGRGLIIRFFHDAPLLQAENIEIRGGVTVQNVHVVDVALLASDDADVPVRLEVIVNRPGDASEYVLHVTGVAEIDQRYASAPFRFRADLARELGCGEAPVPVTAARPAPPLDYLAKDFSGFRQLMLNRLAVTMPGWQERHVPDTGIMLIEVLAYIADRLSYYQDAIATEAYIGTARRRISIRRHARLIDYGLHEGCNARALVQLQPAADGAVAVSALSFRPPNDDPALEFLPLACPHDQVMLRRGCVSLKVHCWGDAGCVLPKGSTSASLLDPAPGDPPALQPGDFLLFEVLVAGPESDPDPDPELRHAVRLTGVERARDALQNQDLLVVSWSAEDALPAELPVDGSARGAFAVIRGNLLLTEHGRRVIDGDWASGNPVAPEIGPGRRRGISLSQPDLSFAEPIHPEDSACRILDRRDPALAIPKIEQLLSWPARAAGEPSGARAGEAPQRWTIRPDLLASGPDDPHATVEVDDAGVAHLRFGAGDCGRDPAGCEFEIHYRTGNGVRGNIGADQLCRLRVVAPPQPAIVAVRNPLPARGGTPPEDIEKVRILAPFVFRETRLRAITAEDYAALAVQLVPELQRAEAFFIASEGRELVRIAIDPKGTDAPDHGMLGARVTAALEPYRRIGHDLLVVRGDYVPLRLVLRVLVQEGYQRSHVKAGLRVALGCGVLPDGTLAPFHPDRLTFGTPIYGSQIIAIAQDLDGVANVEIAEFGRLFDQSRGGYGNGVLRMRWNEIPQLDNDPLRPDQGRLLLHVSGGRA